MTRLCEKLGSLHADLTPPTAQLFKRKVSRRSDSPSYHRETVRQKETRLSMIEADNFFFAHKHTFVRQYAGDLVRQNFWYSANFINRRSERPAYEITIMRKVEVFCLGVIQQLRGQNFAIFWPPPPPWTIFIHWAWTKQTFLTTSPHLPHLVHVVIEWPLTDHSYIT